MRLRTFRVLALVALVSVSVASAQTESGWYVGVGVQVNLLEKRQLGLRIEWVTIDTKSDTVDFTNLQGAVLYRF